MHNFYHKLWCWFQTGEMNLRWPDLKCHTILVFKLSWFLDLECQCPSLHILKSLFVVQGLSLVAKSRPVLHNFLTALSYEQPKSMSSVRQRQPLVGLPPPNSLTDSVHFVTLYTVQGVSSGWESTSFTVDCLRGLVFFLLHFFSKVDLLPHHHQLWCCLLGRGK